MIQCERDKPRCRKRAVCYILLKGMKPAPGLENLVHEASMADYCTEHANDMLYGSKRSLDQAGLTLLGCFLQGWGVHTENYRVLFIPEEWHSRGEITTDEIALALEQGVQE